MKKYTTKLMGFAAVLALLTQCQEADNPIYDVLENFTNGAVLRTVVISSAEFNSFDTSTYFEATIEEQDEENGNLLEQVQVYLDFDDNTADNGTTSKSESLYATLPASSFTDGEFGLPRYTLKITLAEAISFLDLTDAEFSGGDAIDIRLELHLTDGRVFSSSDSTGSLQGSYFNSPYTYKSVIKCIPINAVPGKYTFEMTDSYGDGWQGSHIKVTVDGTETYYGIPSTYDEDAGRNAILEAYTGDNSSGSGSLVIPETAHSMSFEWVSGDWPAECGFTIRFENLDGTAEQSAYSESNPSDGEKVLSICN